MFAMIFKLLPDVTIAWRNVWLGAAEPPDFKLMRHYRQVRSIALTAGPVLDFCFSYSLADAAPLTAAHRS